MQAPLAGLVLVLELTAGGFPIVIPMIAATVTATAVARYIDGYSIYTARLGARPDDPAVAPAGGAQPGVAAPAQKAADPSGRPRGARSGPGRPG
jgi:hypothetical protein